MSIVRVFYNPLDANSEETYQVEPGTPVIEFLQKEFPEGFGAPIRVIVGYDEIEPDDYDYVIKDKERITILVMPATAPFLAAVGSYLLQAAIAFAIGYVINLIFKPKEPGQLDRGDESPVYSIGPTRNTARLGSPITAHYGTVIWPPDFGSAPYVFNSGDSNDQFVDELLVLGHGQFGIEAIFVGNSNVNQLELGAVKYWIFDSSQHMQQIGNIDALVWDQVKDSETPFRFYENVFTSPEISDFIFEDKTTIAVTTPTAFAGSAFAKYTDSFGNEIPGRIENVDSSLDISVGDEMILTGTALNNIRFFVSSVTQDPATPLVKTVFQSWNDPQQLVEEDPLPPGTLYELNSTQDNKSAGPFRAQRDGDLINEIWIDITFPQGLFGRDGTDGDLQHSTVVFFITYQEIDITGAPVGLPIDTTFTVTRKTTTPYRTSVSSGPLTPGMYEVTMSRDGLWDDQRYTDTAQWSGLRGIIEYDTSQTVYGDVTIMAIRMKATSGLGQAARDRVRVKAKRILDDPGADSGNPITVIKDIWTNTTYGLGQDIGRLDEATLAGLEASWVGPDAPVFNGSFDSRSTGYDAMQAVASLAGANIVQDGGLLTVVVDHIQDVRAAVFSTANVLRDSLSILYTFDPAGDYDGIQIEYRDPANWDVAYAYFPVSPQPSNPETYTLFGCTNPTYAGEFANYLDNIKSRRRKLVTLSTELEGLIPRFGDRIGVSTPMPSWGQSGVFVQEIDSVTWYVDQELDWTVDNVLILRTELGTGSQMYTVTMGATANIVVFDSAPSETIFDASMQDPTNYMFGTADDIIRDFMITKVSPKSDMIIEIEAQTYDETIYTDGAPPHMSGCLYDVDSYRDWWNEYQSGKLYVSYWPMDDIQGPGTASDLYGINTLSSASSFGHPSLLDDGRTCARCTLPSIGMNTPGFLVADVGGDIEEFPVETGTFGILHKPVGTGGAKQIALFWLNFGTGSQGYVRLNYISGDQYRISLDDEGPDDIQINFNAKQDTNCLQGGAQITVAWEKSSAGPLTQIGVDIYANGQLVFNGIPNPFFVNTTYNATPGKVNICRQGTTGADHYVQHAFAVGSIWDQVTVNSHMASLRGNCECEEVP